MPGSMPEPTQREVAATPPWWPPTTGAASSSGGVPGLGGTVVAVVADTEEQTDTRTDTRLARPWNVVVHDDPITPMPYVSKVFQEVFGFSSSKAESLMLRVHHTGRAVVWSGARESAEVYVQKLQGRHLRTTLEQSEA